MDPPSIYNFNFFPIIRAFGTVLLLQKQYVMLNWDPQKLMRPPRIYCNDAIVLDLRYKIEDTSNHGAKFRGDRPTQLGDTLAN